MATSLELADTAASDFAAFALQAQAAGRFSILTETDPEKLAQVLVDLADEFDGSPSISPWDIQDAWDMDAGLYAFAA